MIGNILNIAAFIILGIIYFISKKVYEKSYKKLKKKYKKAKKALKRAPIKLKKQQALDEAAERELAKKHSQCVLKTVGDSKVLSIAEELDKAALDSPDTEEVKVGEEYDNTELLKAIDIIKRVSESSPKNKSALEALAAFILLSKNLSLDFEDIVTTKGKACEPLEKPDTEEVKEKPKCKCKTKK